MESMAVCRQNGNERVGKRGGAIERERKRNRERGRGREIEGGENVPDSHGIY